MYLVDLNPFDPTLSHFTVISQIMHSVKYPPQMMINIMGLHIAEIKNIIITFINGDIYLEGVRVPDKRLLQHTLSIYQEPM